MSRHYAKITKEELNNIGEYEEVDDIGELMANAEKIKQDILSRITPRE